MSALTDILIVTYAFPPRGGVAVQRVLSWVKYFPAHGLRPIVLTVHPPQGAGQMDESLLAQIPPEARVIRTTALEPYRLYRALGGQRAQDAPGNRAALQSNNVGAGLRPAPTGAGEVSRPRSSSPKNYAARAYTQFADRYLIPDPKIGWMPLALEAARALWNETKPAAVLATQPPASTLVIGAAIGREHGVPLIADYRDPWTTGYYEGRWPDGVRQRQEALERRVLKEAAAVVTVSEDFSQKLSGLLPYPKNLDTLRVVSNGFEAELYKNLESMIYTRPTILHAGSLYQQRSPEPLFQACAALARSHPGLWAQVDLRFLGNADPALLAEAADLGLTNVLAEPFVPHRAALAAQAGADILVLLTEGMLTGKVYEYLATRRPVLAIGPSPELDRLLQFYGAGRCFAREDIQGIAAFLLIHLQARIARGKPVPLALAHDLRGLQRDVLAERMAAICWAAIEQRPLPGEAPTPAAYTRPE